jgi:hypothetical protein
MGLSSRCRRLRSLSMGTRPGSSRARPRCRLRGSSPEPDQQEGARMGPLSHGWRRGRDYSGLCPALAPQGGRSRTACAARCLARLRRTRLEPNSLSVSRVRARRPCDPCKRGPRWGPFCMNGGEGGITRADGPRPSGRRRCAATFCADASHQLVEPGLFHIEGSSPAPM